MQRNRTMPDDVLVPVLAYPSVSEAVDWLTGAFGFTFRWQVEEHRAQLGVGDSAAIVITEGPLPTGGSDHVMVRVADVDAHRARAVAAGATVEEATDHFYGERQYTPLTSRVGGGSSVSRLLTWTPPNGAHKQGDIPR